ncbi:MAG: C40 family peptidase [Gammaproteobacteria bacterium]|nr:C40 family peptidase [Gammaproteobacteria bacterium]MDH3416085.1 C40 family peptidase [Gammaproteobacteria bacterium]
MYMISQPAQIVRHLALIVVIAVAAAACSSQPSVTPAAKADRRVVVQPRTAIPIGERAAAVALGQLGAPYRYGGSSPTGFDCSGLVHYAYSSVGMSVPRTTAGLWSDLAPIDNGSLRIGDLLFFSIAGKMSHVGMYLGSRKFVHAPSSGRHVSVESLDSEYYRRAFIRAGRPK